MITVTKTNVCEYVVFWKIRIFVNVSLYDFKIGISIL